MLTSGQARECVSFRQRVSNHNWALSQLRPVGCILYIFLPLLSRKCCNLNPYHSSPSPRSFSLGSSLAAILILSFFQTTQRLQLSSWVLTKKNADMNTTITLSIFLHVIIVPRRTILSPFPTNTISPVTATNCLPLWLVSLSKIFKALLFGDGVEGTKEHVWGSTLHSEY